MKPSRYQITTSQNGKNQQGPFICREIRRFFFSSSSSTLPRETRRWRWRQSRPSQLFFFPLVARAPSCGRCRLSSSASASNNETAQESERQTTSIWVEARRRKKKPRRKRKTTFTRSRGPKKGRSENGRSSSCDGCRGRGCVGPEGEGNGLHE